jgi:hypothetical protein
MVASIVLLYANFTTRTLLRCRINDFESFILLICCYTCRRGVEVRTSHSNMPWLLMCKAREFMTVCAYHYWLIVSCFMNLTRITPSVSAWLEIGLRHFDRTFSKQYIISTTTELT